MPNIVLPEIVVNRLIAEAKRIGIPPEELASEILIRELSRDPEDHIKLYLSLYKKYIQEAEGFIRKRDYVQASEKIWGAAASIVKAVALKKLGKRLASHGELWEFVSSIVNETKDQEVGLLWRTAISMHINFYENWAPPEEVTRALEQIKVFAKKLAKYAGISIEE